MEKKRIIDALAERAKLVIQTNWVTELLKFMKENEISDPVEFDYRDIPISVSMVYWPNQKLPVTHGALGSQALLFRKFVSGAGWVVVDDDFEAQTISKSLFALAPEAPVKEEAPDGDSD